MSRWQAVRGRLRGRGLWLLGSLAAGLCAAAGAALALREELPTAEVKQGEWIDHVELRGEVKALRSLVLNAPPNASGELQILKLVASGTQLKAGDVVAQFDSTTSRRSLEEDQAELKQAEAEIDRVRAEGRLQAEQNQTDEVKTGYDVERWQLETGKQEILSEIQGEKTKLSLADARYRHREAQAKTRSGKLGNAAEVERVNQKRRKQQFEVERGQDVIEGMMLRAPMAGMVTRLPNHRARQGGFGGDAPEFKEGDKAWSGAAIAEIPDLSSVRVTARVDEIDRGRIRIGQSATVRVDAVPDREFEARIAEISPLAKPDFSSWPPAKSFDVVLELKGTDPRLRPGMSASGRVAVERRADALLIPAQACFRKQGRTVVYVRRGFGFSERPIEIARRSARQVAVARGLAAGEQVALVDPTAEEAPE